MKLFITGGAGFIGSNFVQYWRAHYPDDALVVFDQLTYAGNRANLAAVADEITFIQGDITDAAAVEHALGDCDTIVHFAAESHNDRALENPFIFTHTNVIGTHILLEAARKRGGMRFHHISTDEVYGDIPLTEHWKFNERTQYNPRSAYSASKAGSDHIVNAYHETFGLPTTISNCGNNYGPYQHPEKFIPRSIIRLLLGKNIPVYTPGNQVRDWLFVNDHCRAIDLILHRGTIGQTYCIGGMTNEITNLEVSKRILRAMNLTEERIDFITDRPGHDVKYALDWSKIQRELGWQPEHDFDFWLKETVAWYQNNADWWKETSAEAENFYQQKGEAILKNS